MPSAKPLGSLESGLLRKLTYFYHQFPSADKFDEDRFLNFVFLKDPSFRRRSRSLLVKLVERIMDEQQPMDPEDSSNDELDVPLMTVKDSNFMNKSLMKVYQPPGSESTNQNGDSIGEIPAESTAEIPTETPEVVTDVSGEITTRKRPSTKTKSSEAKKQKTSKSAVVESSTKLADMGGIDSCIDELLELIGVPLKYPEIYRDLNIQPPRGILLHGPPGCGKTMLANAIAGQCQVPFLNISAPSVVSGMSGESEKRLREVFDEAKQLAPCILFIDEIDAITPKRETAQREMERRIVAQLLTCMDDIAIEKTNYKAVILIGATNRPDSLDPALRRAGRFDREIALGVPDEQARHKILQKMCSKMKLHDSVNTESLAKLTPGYVGADLNALMSEAGVLAVRRIVKRLMMLQDPSDKFSSMDLDDTVSQKDPQSNLLDFLSMPASEKVNVLQDPSISITHDDFLAALKKVQPSAKREGFATVPDVCWDDIGALKKVREELRMAVVEPVKYPEYYQRVGIVSPVGVLLYGPPGCGKTLLAKAVANESHCNFISVKGPELLNKYVGESERSIRQVFARAAASAPCIIFFDELDALAPSRTNEGDSQHSSRVVNALLTEMDGMSGRKSVYVIAATNRPDMIDAAMLRPGRLDKALYVDLPCAEERFEILQTMCRKLPLHTHVCLKEIACDSRTEGFSGADLASLVRETGVAALRTNFEVSEHGLQVSDDVDPASIFLEKRHFEMALSKVSPSVSVKDRQRYQSLKKLFSSGASS